MVRPAYSPHSPGLLFTTNPHSSMSVYRILYTPRMIYAAAACNSVSTWCKSVVASATDDNKIWFCSGTAFSLLVPGAYHNLTIICKEETGWSCIVSGPDHISRSLYAEWSCRISMSYPAHIKCRFGYGVSVERKKKMAWY